MSDDHLLIEKDGLCKHEWYQVPEVHAITARSAPRVEEEWFTLLISVKNSAKIADAGPCETSYHGVGKNITHRWEKNIPRRTNG